MFYVVTALHCEAKPLIEHFKLKKDLKSHRFQIFKNEEMALIISGTGALPAAVATTHLLTLYGAKDKDLILNVGICGTARSEYKHAIPVLCHKIIHHETKKTYYPDILIKHSLAEGTLETFPYPVQKNMASSVEGDLVDMEGAGFYEAAASFLPPHKIHCLKVVSDNVLDNLGEIKLSRQTVSCLICQNIPAIYELMKTSKLAHMNCSEVLTENDYNLLHRLSQNLHLSTAMTHQLYKLARQYKIRSGKSLSCLQQFLNDKANSKSEGKACFERLKKQLVLE